MPDLVVRNGLVYLGCDLVAADLVVSGGRVTGIVQRGEAPPSAQDLDATGLLVLPGLIDQHVHFREPGYEYKEDFYTGSRAAAAGGITMYVDMPNLDPPPNTLERFLAQNQLAAAKSVVDFNHWAMPTRLDEIAKIAQAGAAGFKVFMKSAHYPYGSEISITDHGQLLEAFRAIAATGRPCLVHPHNQMLWEQRVAARVAEGRVGLADWADATYGDDDVVETTAIATIVLLAKAVGLRLCVLHVQGRPQVRLVRMLKASGFRFLAETNPWSIVHIDPIGLRDPEDLAENFRAMNEGTVDLIGSDHAPHTLEEHEQCKVNAFESVVAGYPLCEHWAAIFLTAVNQGKLSLRRFVEMGSTTPARHIGVYPRKGVIRVGSDADFVIVDMERTAVLGETYPVYSKIGFTPLHGLQVQGVPVYTIVRGQVVMDHGEVVGRPGTGQFVPPLRADPEQER
jgi:dihydroorotase (multifunctional complex type)